MIVVPALLLQAISPPPPSIYDPVPGPFMVVVDGKGHVEDVGVISNASRSWAGPKLSAFILCFHSASPGTDRRVVQSALDDVSLKLKAQGANTVVTDAGRLCHTPAPPSLAGKTYVEIRGVVPN